MIGAVLSYGALVLIMLSVLSWKIGSKWDEVIDKLTIPELKKHASECREIYNNFSLAFFLFAILSLTAGVCVP